MIRLNLATKPGLQPIDTKEIEFAPSILETERTTGSKASEFAPIPDDLLREGEKQLQELERKEDEFVPRHVSVPPSKERETKEKIRTGEALGSESSAEERGTPHLKKRRRKTFRLVAILIILCLLIAGGYWIYKSYHGAGRQIPAITSLMTKLGIGAKTPSLQTTEAPTELITKVQKLPTLSNEDAYLAWTSAYYLQKFAQLISWFPPETRLNRAKLNFNRIHFIAHLSNNTTIQAFKSTILASGDYETPEVFQVDSTTAEKHVLAVIQIKSPVLPDSLVWEALNDTAINIKVWHLGKQNQLVTQPLALYGTTLTESHRAEVTAQGAIPACGQFLFNLGAAKINWRVETVLLKTAALDQTPSDIVNLMLSATILVPHN